MSELIGRGLAAQCANGCVMADFAEADEARELLKGCNLRLQERCALADLRGLRLVGGRRTLDRIGDHRAF